MIRSHLEILHTFTPLSRSRRVLWPSKRGRRLLVQRDLFLDISGPTCWNTLRRFSRYVSGQSFTFLMYQKSPFGSLANVVHFLPPSWPSKSKHPRIGHILTSLTLESWTLHRCQSKSSRSVWQYAADGGFTEVMELPPLLLRKLMAQTHKNCFFLFQGGYVFCSGSSR